MNGLAPGRGLNPMTESKAERDNAEAWLIRAAELLKGRGLAAAVYLDDGIVRIAEADNPKKELDVYVGYQRVIRRIHHAY